MFAECRMTWRAHASQKIFKRRRALHFGPIAHNIQSIFHVHKTQLTTLAIFAEAFEGIQSLDPPRVVS